ncbi:hypothetical protein TMatcc_001540 [Talaromyces marneffei ATCC 18224]
MNSEYARDGIPTGTSLFRAPEVHLEIPWNTAADIWSLGVTRINLIWGLNFHIFEPPEPEGHDISLYANISGSDRSPFLTRRYADKETQEAILGIIPSGEVETIQIYRRKDRSVLADKQFVLKMMKLDPRDRPTARELLKDQWFTESSERTVGWFSKEEWEKMGYK